MKCSLCFVVDAVKNVLCVLLLMQLNVLCDFVVIVDFCFCFFVFFFSVLSFYQNVSRVFFL